MHDPVGAKTVNGPGPLRVSFSFAAFTAAIQNREPANIFGVSTIFFIATWVVGVTVVTTGFGAGVSITSVLFETCAAGIMGFTKDVCPEI